MLDTMAKYHGLKIQHVPGITNIADGLSRLQSFQAALTPAMRAWEEQDQAGVTHHTFAKGTRDPLYVSF